LLPLGFLAMGMAGESPRALASAGQGIKEASGEVFRKITGWYRC